MSEAYDKACAAWVDEVMKENRPFIAERIIEGKRKPEPATHADERMHLELGDMPNTDPAWPSGVKQHLTGYRHGTQSDSDPDTKQHSMVTEGPVIRADCPGDAEDGYACSKCGRYETITNGRHPCADGISQEKYGSIAQFSEDLRAGKGGDLVISPMSPSHYMGIFDELVENYKEIYGVDVRGGPEAQSAARSVKQSPDDNAPLTSIPSALTIGMGEGATECFTFVRTENGMLYYKSESGRILVFGLEYVQEMMHPELGPSCGYARSK